jgi:hypothetical protein
MMALLQKMVGELRSYKTGPSCDKNLHLSDSFYFLMAIHYLNKSLDFWKGPKMEVKDFCSDTLVNKKGNLLTSKLPFNLIKKDLLSAGARSTT